MTTIEIESLNEFTQVKVYVNTKLVVEQTNCKSLTYNIDQPLPADIDIEFQPFKIRPIVRLDNFLLDYWLANIILQDHKLSIRVTDTFFQDYKNKNIEGRIASLPLEQKNSEQFWDNYIGVNNLYPELTNEIKELINK